LKLTEIAGKTAKTDGQGDRNRQAARPRQAQERVTGILGRPAISERLSRSAHHRAGFRENQP